MIVDRLRTPVPSADLPPALVAAHRVVHGDDLSIDGCAIVCAQFEVEHGRRVISWTDVMAWPDTAQLLGVDVFWAVWGLNLGNRDATDAQRADQAIAIFSTVPEHEVATSGAGFTARHWRCASADLPTACADYWRFMTGAFPEAYEAMRSGDVEGFVHQLKLRRYFTAGEVDYDRLEESLVAAWRQRLG